MDIMKREENDKLNKLIAKTKRGEKYRITKDNEDGSMEVVYRINGTYKEAIEVFNVVVKEQATIYHESPQGTKWRVIRLFDSKTDEEIMKES